MGHQLTSKLTKAINKIEKKRGSAAEVKRREAREKKRLAEWAAFLEDDADWDYDCILRVFAYKLRRVRQCILKNNIVMDAAKIAKEIEEVENIFLEVRDEDNFRGPLDEMDKKWGKSKQFDFKKLPSGGSQYSVKRAEETPENEKQVTREVRKAYRDCHKLRVKRFMQGLKLMSERIWCWWD